MKGKVVKRGENGKSGKIGNTVLIFIIFGILYQKGEKGVGGKNTWIYPQPRFLNASLMQTIKGKKFPHQRIALFFRC